MQKKLLKQGAAAVTLNPTPVTTPTPVLKKIGPFCFIFTCRIVHLFQSTSSDSLNPAQRQALTHAHTSSFGYFVAQDSSFGNFILPVIPRLEKLEPTK